MEVSGRTAGVSYALDIVHVSKRFQRRTVGRAGYTTLKSSLLGFFLKQKRQAGHVTHAIQDLTLRIPSGASVGIIGRNGSGKSTLLKLISGIYKPTRGTIAVNGRIAALIELGAGFHPDFSGRENLYLGGAMHGLSRAEIDERFEAIVKFAELEDVIDDPVRTYSSGMFMRLGFSLAVHTDPDILIVDEVLAVGDAAFVNKCKERIAQLRREGKTLLLVTHDLDAVERWCDEALWLNDGQVRDRGHPRRVIDHYREWVARGEERELLEEAAAGEAAEDNPEQAETPVLEQERERWGSREVEITKIRMLNDNGEEALSFNPADGAIIEVHYTVREPAEEVVFGIGINRSDGLVVHGSNTDLERLQLPDLGREGVVRYYIRRLGLLDGLYTLDIAVHKRDGYAFDYHKGALRFAMRTAGNQIGVYLPEHRWEISPGADASERTAGTRGARVEAS